jgi:hypothetical protein
LKAIREGEHQTEADGEEHQMQYGSREPYLSLYFRYEVRGGDVDETARAEEYQPDTPKLCDAIHAISPPRERSGPRTDSQQGAAFGPATVDKDAKITQFLRKNPVGLLPGFLFKTDYVLLASSG